MSDEGAIELPDQQPPVNTWPSGPVTSGAMDTGSVPAPAAPRPPATSNNAVVALVLSILSWVGWGMCPIVMPLVLAIVGLVLAGKADKEIAASRGQVTGSGLTLSSRIIAWVNIGVTAAAVLIGIFVVIVLLVGGALDSEFSTN